MKGLDVAIHSSEAGGYDNLPWYSVDDVAQVQPHQALSCLNAPQGNSGSNGMKMAWPCRQCQHTSMSVSQRQYLISWQSMYRSVTAQDLRDSSPGEQAWQQLWWWLWLGHDH